MPSSDLILNTRQLAGYDPTSQALVTDSALLQRGLGGPYLSISPADFVGTALSQGGDMTIAGMLTAGAIQVGPLQATTLQAIGATFTMVTGQTARFTVLDADFASVAGDPLSTQGYVDNAVESALCSMRSMYDHNTVWSFNNRVGNIILDVCDVIRAGGAPIFSPKFDGSPCAPTPKPLSNSQRIATTEWVNLAVNHAICQLLQTQSFVFSFNGRTGDVTLQPGDIQLAEAALLDSPPLTGTPTAPTAPPGTDTDQLATTAFVLNAINTILSASLAGYAPINSPAFTGTPTGLTAPPGTATGQLATTAFVMQAVTAATAGVASFNARTGAVTLNSSDILNAGGAVLDSPIFTGSPTAPTPLAGNNSNAIATTAWVMNELGGAQIGVASFNGRGGAVTLQQSDITGAGGAILASPAFSGVPTAPTAATGTSTDQLATTAFVVGEIANATAGVSSFNGRTGAVTLNASDISAAGGATLLSPIFVGAPTGPTAAVGTNTTQLATTAYVMAQIAAGAVTSFDGRTGAITLIASDITSAGGALLASPGFTGNPTAPTQTAGTSNTTLATTAFVSAAIGAAVPTPLTIPRGGTGQTTFAWPTGWNAFFNESPTPFVTGGVNTSLGQAVITSAYTGGGATWNNAYVASNGAFLEMAAAGANTPFSFIYFKRARNTFAAPQALQNGDVMGAILCRGWNGTNSGGGSTASIYLLAGENFTSSSMKSWMQFSVNPGGTTNAASPTMEIWTGGLNLYPSAGDIGTAGINYNGQTGGSAARVGFVWTQSQWTLWTNVGGGNTVALPVLTSQPPSTVGNPGHIGSIGWNPGGGSMMGYSVYNAQSPSWNVTAVSDRRLKKNVKAATVDALALIRKLGVYACDAPIAVGADERHWDASLMADELEELIPLAVNQGEYKTVREWPVVAMLIKAVQELTAKIERLEGGHAAR